MTLMTIDIICVQKTWSKAKKIQKNAPRITPMTAHSRDRRKTACPRLSKKYIQEWQFFLDDRNRIKYNELCKKCDRECKQSFRAIIIDCPYERKNRKKKRQ